MVGNMISDALTTEKYYDHWKFSSPNAISTSSRTIFDHGEPGFFYFAITIWTFTPLLYALQLYSTLLKAIFDNKRFRHNYSDEFNKIFTKMLFHIIRLFNYIKQLNDCRVAL